MTKRSIDNSHDGESLAKRVRDATSAGIEAAAITFLQVFRGQDPRYPFKMLFIGEAGSGKTSFLNLLYNCATVQALGCGFGKEGLEYFRQFNDIQLENAQSISESMESKTNAATRYNVEIGGLKIGIIDTPGFGDSRGVQQDEINVERIIDVLKKEEYINCVCLIISGRQPRESALLKYVLTKITAILPREILQNVIVVFSNTGDSLDLILDQNELAKYFGRQVLQGIFFIENPYCRLDKAKDKVAQLGMERVAKCLQKSFDDTVRVLTEMCLKIKDFQQVHTRHFITLYEKKQAIEGNVLPIITEYDKQAEIEKAIQKTKEEIDAAVNTKTLNKDYQLLAQRLKRWIVAPTSYYNTLCGYADCHSNCHKGCGLSKSYDKDIFKNCSVMQGENNTCTACGHSYMYHYREQGLFKEVEEVKDLIDQEMQSKFEKAKSDQQHAQLFYIELEKQKQSCKMERLRLSIELLHKIKEFEELGVARNYVKVIENQLAVIETRLKDTIGSESEHLRKTQEGLKKKLDVVKGALSGLIN
jgi:GTP-binding protein EngB required for normal cell division